MEQPFKNLTWRAIKLQPEGRLDERIRGEELQMCDITVSQPVKRSAARRWQKVERNPDVTSALLHHHNTHSTSLKCIMWLKMQPIQTWTQTSASAHSSVCWRDRDGADVSQTRLKRDAADDHVSLRWIWFPCWRKESLSCLNLGCFPGCAASVRWQTAACFTFSKLVWLAVMEKLQDGLIICDQIGRLFP